MKPMFTGWVRHGFDNRDWEETLTAPTPEECWEYLHGTYEECNDGGGEVKTLLVLRYGERPTKVRRR